MVILASMTQPMGEEGLGADIYIYIYIYSYIYIYIYIYPVALPRRPATALGMDVGLLWGGTRELNIAPERTQFRPKS